MTLRKKVNPCECGHDASGHVNYHGECMGVECWPRKCLRFDQAYEYAVDVPRMYRNAPDEPNIVIGISAHGGGTVGQSYAHNGWDYAVYANERKLISGDGLRTNGTPGSHAQMARTLCSFLANDGEAMTFGAAADHDVTSWSADQAEFLQAEYERLSLFSDDELS